MSDMTEMVAHRLAKCFGPMGNWEDLPEVRRKIYLGFARIILAEIGERKTDEKVEKMARLLEPCYGEYAVGMARGLIATMEENR